MNYSENIKNADWLNKSQKERLLAVYETIEWKDVIEQSFDMLDLTRSRGERKDAVAYKNMVVNIMANLFRLKLGEYDARDYGEFLNNLYLFFDNLDCKSFDKLCDIEEAYNYSDESGNHEPTIDKLYRATLSETKEKLRLLETV